MSFLDCDRTTGRPLLIFFAALQLADIVTTNCALALPGHREINPVMAGSMAQLGPAWWLPKLAIIGAVALTALWAHRRRSKILMSALYACIAITLTVVASNLAQL